MDIANALADLLAAFENDRGVTHFGEKICRDKASWAGTDDHGPMRKRRLARFRHRERLVGLKFDPDASESFEVANDASLVAGQANLRVVDKVNVALVARIEAFAENSPVEVSRSDFEKSCDSIREGLKRLVQGNNEIGDTNRHESIAPSARSAHVAGGKFYTDHG